MKLTGHGLDSFEGWLSRFAAAAQAKQVSAVNTARWVATAPFG